MKVDLTKERIIKLIASFLGAMLLLTAMATTIKEYLLPAVVVEVATSGKLEKKVITSGLIGEDQDIIKKKQKRIEAPSEGIIQNCLLEQYQEVKKGEILLTIGKEMDTKEVLEKDVKKQGIESQVSQLKREKETQDKELANLQQAYNKEKEGLMHLEENQEIRDAKGLIEKKEKEVVVNKDLYAIGTLSKQDYDKTVEELEKAKTALITFKKNKKEDAETKLSTLQLQMERLKNKTLDIQDTFKGLDKQLALENIGSGAKQIIAPMDGYIYNLSVGEGMSVDKKEELLTLIPSNVPYILRFSVPIEQGELIKTGNKANFIINEAKREAEITSKSIDSESDSYIVKAVITAEVLKSLNLKSGDYRNVTVDVSQSGKEHKMVVPLSAIAEELGKKYIYVAQKEESVWGDTYHAKQILVTIVEDNNYYAAIEATIPAEGKVITRTSKSLKDGMEIRME